MGASWLVILGPYIADYSLATIKFYLQNEFITLQGDKFQLFAIAQFNHHKRFSAINAIQEMYKMYYFALDGSKV